MTQNYSPPTTIDDRPDHDSTPAQRADGVGGTDAAKQVANDAKDQAAQVGQGAVDAGQHVAGVAKDQAVNVVAEAGRQAQDLLTQAQTELAAQAQAQQHRVVDGLRTLGDELRSMTEHDGSKGVATDLAQQAADRSHTAATWLDNREPGQIMNELKGFARQRPVVFLAAAVGAGLLAGRLTRGVKATGSDDAAPTPGTSGSADAHQQAPTDSAPITSATPEVFGSTSAVGGDVTRIDAPSVSEEAR